MTDVWYCTREQVKAAADMGETTRANAAIDRLIPAATRSIEGDVHRRFYPEVGTRALDWPDVQQGSGYRLWLGRHEVTSVSRLASGGIEIPPSDYLLRPVDGPPYTYIETNLGRSAVFGGGATNQGSIELTGTFGACADERDGGDLADAIGTGSTTVEVTDGSLVGVGALLRIGDERMQVTGRTLAVTDQTVQVPLTALKSDVLVQVDDGLLFTLGETIVIGAERMRIDDIAADALIVERAHDGSVLAAHDPGATVYASRLLRVTRAVLGTAAGTHTAGDPIRVHVVPALVEQLAIAETLNALAQEGAGYARVIGQGASARAASGAGLADLREQVRTRYGRMRIGVA